MKSVYSHEIEFAGSLETAEKFQYLTSILRSLLQTGAICSFEIARNMTSSAYDNANLPALLTRFSQPSDGLPIEALDVLVPLIRSQVSRVFLIGWFEKENQTTTLGEDLLAWVEFRNKRPGHGVLDQNNLMVWCEKMEILAKRTLAVFEPILPVIDILGDSHIDLVGNVIEVDTPLVHGNRAIVISKISSRKGIWKLYGHALSWTDAADVTKDLGSSSIFIPQESFKTADRFRLTEIPDHHPPTSVFNNLPVRQTDVFVGRAKELEKLQDWMEDRADSRFCLIYGDGGFGKTTLALEFFNRLLEGRMDGQSYTPTIISYYTAKKTKWTDNGLVHFKGISDAMEDSVRELLYFLYPVLDKSWYKIEGEVLINRIVGEFKAQGLSRDDIVLILDNTETLATSSLEVEELSEFLLRVGKRLGRVVITSRRREFLPATPIPVNSLPSAEAADLMRSLGEQYGAKAVVLAGESRLRAVCAQLLNKPLLIDTLVKYIARSSSSIQDGLDQILKKTNDELLEFLYEDAWLRMNDLAKQVFLVLVNLANIIDGRTVGDACQEVGIQHTEFQGSLDETYFATITDFSESYELEIIGLAKKFFEQKLKRLLPAELDRVGSMAAKVDRNSTSRQQVELEYRLDRVADAFRSTYAKAAKIATFKGDLSSAKDNFDLALLEEPMNAALHDRFALFMLRNMQFPLAAKPLAEKAVLLDPRNADAWLTLGLIKYRLDDLKGGDEAIGSARANGKPESLCCLRRAIARYYHTRRFPYKKDTIQLLKEAEFLLELSLKSADSTYVYYRKNCTEARKYLTLTQSLRAQINRRDISAALAAGPQTQT
jgi:AAA+ ATPase superfamily predicted ATPase